MTIRFYDSVWGTVSDHGQTPRPQTYGSEVGEGCNSPLVFQIFWKLRDLQSNWSNKFTFFYKQ